MLPLVGVLWTCRPARCLTLHASMRWRPGARTTRPSPRRRRLLLRRRCRSGRCWRAAAAAAGVVEVAAARTCCMEGTGAGSPPWAGVRRRRRLGTPSGARCDPPRVGGGGERGLLLADRLPRGGWRRRPGLRVGWQHGARAPQWLGAHGPGEQPAGPPAGCPPTDSPCPSPPLLPSAFSETNLHCMHHIVCGEVQVVPAPSSMAPPATTFGGGGGGGAGPKKGFSLFAGMSTQVGVGGWGAA